MTRNIKLLIVGAIVAAAGLFFAMPALYATGGSCTDQTSVVKCGTSSKAEILAAYDKNERSTQTIYNYMGITRAGIVDASFVSGSVFRNGDVFVNGQKVATGARTAGHNWGSGYSQVKIPNTTDAYSYTTGALVSDNRPVLVSMVNGEFKFAVMTDCGNPIKANPVPKPPQPAYKCDSLSASASKITLGQSVKFTTSASASNGATIKGYTYSFGDGVTKTGGSTIDYTYAKVGIFKASVAVQVVVNGATVNAPGECVATVVVEAQPCPIPGKEHLPKDSPLCVEDKPSVSIDKTVNGKEHATVKVDQTFIYQLIVKNTGNVVLKDAKVTDEAPTGISFVSSASGAIADDVWSTTIAELKVGETKTFEITAKLTKYMDGIIKNTACVDTPTVPGQPDDCDDATIDAPRLIKACRLEDKTIVTISEDQFNATEYTNDMSKCADDKPSVSVDKKINGKEHATVKVGEHFIYQLTVMNTGDVVLKDVKVTDEAPVNIVFVSSASGTTTDDAWSTTIAELKVGESKTFEITAKLTKYVAGSIKNTACVDTPTVPGQPDDCDDATVETAKLIEVCRLEDKAIVTISEDEFDAAKYTEDKTKCAETPNPKADEPTPTELPKTGILDGLGGGLGLGALAASAYYYRASRRLL